MQKVNNIWWQYFPPKVHVLFVKIYKIQEGCRELFWERSTRSHANLCTMTFWDFPIRLNTLGFARNGCLFIKVWSILDLPPAGEVSESTRTDHDCRFLPKNDVPWQSRRGARNLWKVNNISWGLRSFHLWMINENISQNKKCCRELFWERPFQSHAVKCRATQSDRLTILAIMQLWEDSPSIYRLISRL